MRKIFLFLLLLVLCFLLLVIFAGAVIQTNWFWTSALPQYVKHNQAGFILKDISYEEKRVDWKGELFFRNLKVVFQKDQEYQFAFERFRLKDIWSVIFSDGRKVGGEFEGFSVRAAGFDLSDCQINIGADIAYLNISNIEGNLFCEGGQFAGNSISRLSGRIQGSGEWMSVEDFKMNYRDGNVTGRMTLGLNSVFPYVLDLNFHDLVLDQDVFDGNVLGDVTGTFQANGFARHLGGLEIVMDAPEGAKIRADLMQSLVAYLPSKSTAKKDLDAIIKIGGYVYCETTHAEIKRVDDNKATAVINLKTKKLNLVLNPTVDINVEGGLQSVFNVIEFFSNPKSQETP